MIPTQRDIQIISEPCRERNMPPSPKICNGLGDIGMVKILHGRIAKDLRRPDGNMRIAGEITIYLKGVEKSGQH